VKSSELKAMPLIEMLNVLFEYRDGNLYWKVDRRPRTKAGDLAGTVAKRGDKQYRKVRILDKTYMVSRLIYIMHYGNIQDDMRVVHKDGDTMNMRPENLKVVTESEIRIKTASGRKSSSGEKGIRKNNQTGKWMAELTYKGNRKHLGSFETKKKAVEARKRALDDLEISQ
jgi:hypothetical protein